MNKNDYSVNREAIFNGDVADALFQKQKGSGVKDRILSHTNNILAYGLIKDAVVVECRAILTKRSLDRTGVLSMVEDQFCKVAPRGAARYQALVDMYAKQAILQIERW